MAEYFWACSGKVIMNTTDSADRHYFRVNPATGTMIIDDSSPMLNHWSYALNTMSSSTTYAYNYLKSGATDNAYSTAPTLTFSYGDTNLRSSSTNNACIYASSVGSSSCKIYMRGWAWYPSGASLSVRVLVYKDGATSATYDNYHALSTLENSGITVSGLSDSEDYSIFAYADTLYSNGYDILMGSGYFSTSAARPSDFYWTNTHGSGYNCTTLTASEWNSLCSKVNEFRTFKGLSTVSFTSATSGGTFTAAMFNQVRNAIYAMNTSGCPSTVSSGDIVYWSNIDALRTCLNNVS